MKKNIYITVLSLLLVFNGTICKSQFSKSESFAKDKKMLAASTLYVVIDQNAHDNNAEYAKIFEENWKYSKIQIIEPKEVGNYLKEGNYFFTLSVTYEKGFDFDKPAAFLFFNYNLWTPNPAYLKKIKRKNDPDMEIDFSSLAFTIASINLSFDKSQSFKIEDVLKGEYFGNGYPLYTGLGIFKNYIQGFQRFFEDNRSHYFRTITYSNPKEIKKLKNEILYVPTSILVDNSGITFNNYKKNKKPPIKASVLFADYIGKYQVISLKELNEKILNSEEAIYYISHAEDVTVTNSKTGEIIFGQTLASTSTALNEMMDIMEEDDK
ncbi:MAG: hypothetical protein WCO13_11330 [Bacteroidota bacterium]